jgi:hypothetical protein
MNKLDLGSYGSLSAYKLPAINGNHPTIIATGKVSDLINKGVNLSPEIYYGACITYANGLLWEKEMAEIKAHADFPNLHIVE